MNEIRIGVVACASMYDQIKECVASLEGTFKIYPIIPACTFTVKIDLFRQHLDRSIIENNVTLFFYGICHLQILALLAEYGDRVVRLRGSNCYEMVLGTEKYADYHGKCYWMLNKPFFTRYKKEVLAGFEAGTNNGRMLIGDTYKKLLYVRFEKDQLDIDLVEDLASTMGLEYEIHSAETANLKRLLEEALASASPIELAESLEFFTKHPEESEMRTILESIGEIIYKIDIHTKKFTFISPQVKKILGYSEAEFMDIMNDYVQVPFYHEDDRERVVDGRYNFLVRCLNEGVQEVYEARFRVKNKNCNILWVKESIYPYYSSEGIIESFVGKIEDINELKRGEESLRESEKKIRRLYSLLLTAHEDERKRISRDLHDGIGQGLATLKLNSEIIEGNCQFHDQMVKKIMEKNISLMSDMIVDLRKIVSGLRPELLDHLGIIPTLEWYTQNFSDDCGIQIHFMANGFQNRIYPDMETTLYRIIQEALHNVAKHANAKNVWLTLTHHHPELTVLIEDDGRGFDPKEIERKGNSLGLEGMKERVGLLKGKFFLDSAPGKGSRIRIEMNTQT